MIDNDIMVLELNRYVLILKVYKMNEVLNFVNDKSKILLILSEHQVEIEGKLVCPLNQQEIANLVPCGKLKVNQIIKELIEESYVQMIHAKGRYIITDKGYDVLEKLSLSGS